jgi:hypothetical protein
MSAQIEEDQATLERIFTGDRAYATDLMHRIFASNTEQSRLMTSRLLASIYEYKRQQRLCLQGLSREERVQHYMEQVGRHMCICQYSAMILSDAGVCRYADALAGGIVPALRGGGEDCV